MTKRYKLVVILFTIIPSLFFTFSSAAAARQVNIGIVMDEKGDETLGFVKIIQEEAKKLMGPGYTIRFPESKMIPSEWSVRKAQNAYSRLIKDKTVDIVLVAGVISSSAITGQKKFPKPVIAVGLIDPLIQGVRPTSKNTSGIKNLTYILFNRSMERDLKLFHDLVGYKKVGIAASGELIKIVSQRKAPIEKLMAELGAEFVFLPVDNTIDEVISSLNGVDAVYLEYLGKYEEAYRKQLFQRLNEKRLPTFGASVIDLRLGALAAAAPEESMNKVLRRIALNIETALNGEKLSEVPVGISFEEQFSINMETARKIGFSPAFEIMSRAEIINAFTDEPGVPYGLKEVMKEAVRTSLDIAISRDGVREAEKEVNRAKTNYYPSLGASVTETVIDEKRAKLSGGSTAEQTASGKLTLEQLLFSEEQIGSVQSLQHSLEAAGESMNRKVLDVAMEAAAAYINAMKAKTAIRIRNENVDMTRTHLAIAKRKMAVGYSGKSDVYRFESNLATAQTEHLAAINSYRKAKIELNRVMNAALSREVSLKESGLNSEFRSRYINKALKKQIENPADLELYTRFLIQEALRNSPEIKELDASEAALERRRTSLKRKRFLPVVALGAEAGHTFDRSGEGSNIPGVDPPDDNWTAAVSLSWELFSGGSVSVDITGLTIQLNRLKKQKRQTGQLIEQRVRSTILDAVTNAVNLKSSTVSADFASKSLALIQDAYAKGTASVTELTDAQTTSLNADLNRLNAEYDFILAALNVERATGSMSLLETDETAALRLDKHLKRVEAFINNSQEEK